MNTYEYKFDIILFTKNTLKKDIMDDIENIFLISIFAITTNSINTYFDINPFLLIIFINLTVIYYFFKNIHINIDISIRYGRNNN